MPLDLFGNPSVPRSASRVRRPSLLLLSATGHLLFCSVALIASLRAPGVLPEPPSKLVFTPPARIVTLDPTARAPRRVMRTDRSTSEAVPTISADPPIDDRAPVEAATTIAVPTRASGSGVVAFDGPTRIGFGDGAGDGGPGTSLGPARPVEPLPLPAPKTVRRLAPGIREPRKIVSVTPEYPRLAQAAHIQGTVILDIVIGASGTVDQMTLLKSIPALDAAAIAAVRQWRYEPAQLNGSAIPVIITVTVNFSLAQ